MGPLQRALQSVFRRLADPRLFLPFLLLAVLKVLLLTGVARLDLFPAHVIAAALWAFPAAVDLLHYPETLHNLPEISRWIDRVLFVTLGALVNGWAIVYLARTWTQTRLRLFPRLGSGLLRLAALFTLAVLVVALPFAVQRATEHLFDSMATTAALTAGFLSQMLLFTAPAFVVLEGRSLRRSIRLSCAAVAEYPIAIPAAILLLALVHAPTLMLRLPLFYLGASQDPDRILLVALAQIPVDLFGALLAAGLSARFALSFLSRTTTP